MKYKLKNMGMKKDHVVFISIENINHMNEHIAYMKSNGLETSGFNYFIEKQIK